MTVAIIALSLLFLGTTEEIVISVPGKRKLEMLCCNEIRINILI